MRLALILVCLPAWLFGQYAPIDIPREWTFKRTTAAFSPDNPNQKMGDFQPGIRVSVDGKDANTGMWLVRFERYGQPDIRSLILPPNLSKANPEAFSRIQHLVHNFPLLEKMLESPKPWPENPRQLADLLFPGQAGHERLAGSASQPVSFRSTAVENHATSWELRPLSARIDYRDAANPEIVIEYWNKGDAFLSDIQPLQAHKLIKENLEAIQQTFRTNRETGSDTRASSAIAAVRIRESSFLFPNDLRVSLRYDHGEYLMLVIQSIQAMDAQKPKVYDPSSFRETIAANVATSADGHVFIDNIPMIDQGEKGYCAAATLARVLQFYGYAVDQHAMADLAETEAQFSQNERGGTLRKNMIKAMARICAGTPFRLREITKERPEAILEAIEQGIPIIWFIPGHARLLIGVNPDNNQIVYSDSWGLDHAYKTATWDYFVNANQEMWILTPQ